MRVAFQDPHIHDIVEWQAHRRDEEPGGWAYDARHQLLHIQKAAGFVAALLEHADHGQPYEIEPKRLADLIIHGVWLANSLGYRPAQLVSDRMQGFKDGFWPKQTEVEREHA